MPIPPIGDPRRPLHLAIRSLFAFGVMLTLVGSLGLVVVGKLVQRDWSMTAWVIRAVGMLVYVAPGISFLVLASFLKRRRKWAVTVSIVLVSVVVIAGISIVLQALRWGAVDTAISTLGLIIGLTLIAAAGQLIYHLAMSYGAIHLDANNRGFEPLMTVIPLECPEEGRAAPAPMDELTQENRP